MRVCRKTQIDKVLDHLKRCRRSGITSKIAFERYSITRLASAIRDLRKRGTDIETELLRSADGSRYAVYRLAKPNA